MRITVNGAPHDVPEGTTVRGLLDTLGLGAELAEDHAGEDEDAERRENYPVPEPVTHRVASS